MANNVQQYRVSGEAPISVGTGSAGALETLGVSESGVTIEIIEREEPIYTDVGGAQAPVDFKRMGHEALISLRLISWHELIRRKLESRPFVYPNTTVFTPDEGVAVPRGQLLASNGGAFSLAVAAQFEDPWFFPTTKIMGQPRRVTLGTNQTVWDLRFYAWVFIPGNLTSLTGLASASLPRLYSRAIP
jgi:hypothetical protein